MPMDGYTPETCLEFDLAVMEYGEALEAAMRETVETPAPTAKRDPTVQRPRYSEDDLRRFLGIPEDDLREREQIDAYEQEMASQILRSDPEWLLRPGG